MKYSLYNTTIRINNSKYLLYNALSDKFVVLNECAGRNVQRNTADEINLISENLFEKLLESNVIVEDGIDEIAILKQRINDVDKDFSFFHLHVNPTLNCNFKCWYCYEDHIKGSKMSTHTVSCIMKMIQKVVLGNTVLQQFHLGFFGGEPLMYFNSVAKQLIQFTSTLCREHNLMYDVHFTSNGFLLTDEMIAFLRRHNCEFQITLDGGREDHNQVRYQKNTGGSYDKIVANIQKLADADIHVHVRINYTAENIRSVQGIFAEFEGFEERIKKNIVIAFHRVWQDSHNEDISEELSEMIHTFAASGYLVSSDKVMDYVNHSCYGDKRNHLLVNYNSDVFKCTARDFLPENRGGYLDNEGNVVWDSDYLNRRMSMKFSREVCHTCRIAPLCGGGCTQKALENQDTEGCLFSYTEEEIDQIILDRFEYQFLSRTDR